METIVPIVKDYLINSPTIATQIGALFLYYALYHKQPLLHFVRMRITPQDCEKLIELAQLLKVRSQPQYAEARSVLAKLWSTDGGFRFVAEEEELLNICYKSTVKNADKIVEIPQYEPLNLRMEMEDVLDSDEGLIGGMKYLEIAYNEMKEVLGKSDPNLPPSTICSQISERLDVISEILNPTGSEITSKDDGTAKDTGKQRVLRKISAIQKAKNTLNEDTSEEAVKPGPSKRQKVEMNDEPVVTAEEDVIHIDTSFMVVRHKKTLTHVQKCIMPQEAEITAEDPITIKSTPVKPSKKPKITKLRKKRSQEPKKVNQKKGSKIKKEK